MLAALILNGIVLGLVIYAWLHASTREDRIVTSIMLILLAGSLAALLMCYIKAVL